MLRILLLLAILPSCAVFHKSKYLDESLRHEAANNKESVSLILLTSYVSDAEPNVLNVADLYQNETLSSKLGPEGQRSLKSYIERSKSILTKTGLFKEVLITSTPQNSKTRYTIEINNLSIGKSMIRHLSRSIWLGLSFGTLGILPYWEEREVNTSFKLYDNGKVVNTMALTDNYYFGVSVLLLPVTPFYWPGSELTELRNKTITHAIFEMFRLKDKSRP